MTNIVPRVTRDDFLDGAAVGAQAAAAASTGGLSLVAQLGIQASVLVGVSLLSRTFDNKAVLQKRRRIPDPASAEWQKNPLARYPVGDWVIDGGTVMAAFHKQNKDGSKVSTRIDVVIALADYDLPDPQLREPYIRRADADPDTILENTKDGIVCFIDGRREVLVRRTESGESIGGTVTRNPGDSLTSYTVRHHYEPISSSVHAGAIRVYHNRASQSDTVRWQELRAYLNTPPTWWDSDSDKDGNYSESEYYNEAWTADHLLEGVSGIHLIMNYTSEGIAGNVSNNPNKARAQVTSFPSVSFEYGTGVSGNPADTLEYLVTDRWGFDESLLDADQQALARTRCADYSTTLTGSSDDIALRPMRVAGVLTDSETPVRLLQMLETVSGGQVVFRDNKVSLQPGEFKTNTPTSRHLDEQSLWRAPTVTTNIANNQRRNAVQGVLETCLQSARHDPVELPLVRNMHLEAEDNNLFVERVPRIGYVNDWFDAQQLMSFHNTLQQARRRLVLSVFETEETRQWKVGTDIVVNMPSIGITGRVFIIDEIELHLGDGLVLSAWEQPTDDPFAFLDYDDFDQNPDDDILRDIETGDVLVPVVSNVRRADKLTRENIDEIVFEVDRIDKDYNYYLEIEWKTAEATDSYDSDATDYDVLTDTARRFYILPKNLITYRLPNPSFNDSSIVLRMRYRTDDVRSRGLAGSWTADFTSDPSVETPPTVTGLAVTAIQPESAFVNWIPAAYVGHKHVELRYGTGDTVGTDEVGNAITVSGGRSAYGHTLEGLTEGSNYWAQVRFVNEDDTAEDWATAASATFMTTTATARAVPWSVQLQQAFDLTEGDVVSEVLPEAGSIPMGTTIVYALEGTLPSGLSFTAGTRALAGTVAEGSARNRAYILTYKASDSADATRFTTGTVYVNISDDADPITFAQGDLDITAFIGKTTLQPASPQLPQATGGESTLTYSVMRGLPNWLAVDTSTRRVSIAVDNGGEAIPVPTTAHRNSSMIWQATDGTTSATIPISIFVEEEPDIERQFAFQWHSDYITPPTITQTERDRINDSFRPTGWTKAKGTAPTGKPFLWKISRSKVSTGSWTLWVDPVQDVATVVDEIEESEQIAFQWHSDYITAPGITNTQSEQTSDTERPAGWSSARGTAPTGKPFLWRISRRRVGSGPWTLWANPVPDVATVVDEIEPDEQIAFQWHSDYITAPGVTNTQSEQTSDTEVPTGWSMTRGTAPDGKPFLWRIVRTRVGDGPWTLWANPVQDVATVINDLGVVEQIAFQWHSDYITAPGITNTQSEQASDTEVPTGWSFTKGTAPTGKPFLWRIVRRKISSSSWTTWANPVPDVATVASQINTDTQTYPQECFVAHAANAGTATELDAELDTEDTTQRKVGTFLPSRTGHTYSRTAPTPTSAKPNVWRLTRTFSTDSDAITVWAYAGIDDRFIPTAPDAVALRYPQECFFLSAEGAVGDLPDLSGQSDDNKVDVHYRPTGCVDSVPTPTSAKPNVWRLTRVWSTDKDVATAWAYAGISARFLAFNEQTAYRSTATNVAPGVTNTMSEQTADSEVPDGWTTTVLKPTHSAPFVWSIRRQRIGKVWTLWAHVSPYDEFVLEHLTQRCYFLAADGAVSSLPSLSGQTDANKTDIDYRPTGTTDTVPVPTAAKPNAWELERRFATIASEATEWAYTRIVRQRGVTVEQEAWQLSTTMTAPTVTNTQSEQYSDTERPAGWSASRLAVTAAKQYLFRITRSRRWGYGGWSVWGNAEQVEAWEDLTPSTQYAYQVGASGTVAPTITNTMSEQTADAERPASWSATPTAPSTATRFLWRIIRTRVGSRPWSVWGNPIVINELPDIPQRLTQTTYFLSANGSVGDLPSLAGQTDANKIDIDYRPTGTTDAVPTPTATKPNVWELTRVWSDRASAATAWAYARIVERYEAAALPMPRFAESQFIIYQETVNRALAITLPTATYSGTENLIYSLSPPVPANAGFSSSSQSITGAVATVGVSSHQYKATVSGTTRSTSLAIVLNIIPPPPAISGDGIDDL